MAKIQPAVKTVFFTIDPVAPGVTDTNFIDIAQCASIINRRSYRQGLNWVVGGFKIIVLPGYLGTCNITKLPDTWVTSNSWQKAYANWQEQRREVLKESPSLSAKWADFKIFMDPVHVAAGFASNLTPIDAAADPYLIGEWMESDVVVPLLGGAGGSAAAPEVSMHMIGDNVPAGQFDPATTTSAGLITAYAQSRATVLAPDPVQPGGSNLSLYNELALHDEMSEHALNNAVAENNEPPYDIDDYPGGVLNAPEPQVVDTTAVTARTLTDTAMLKGDTFPCGLVRVTNITDAGSAVSANKIGLLMYLVPGKDKGYMTQNMQDM
jgi:hypothetical protein